MFGCHSEEGPEEDVLGPVFLRQNPSRIFLDGQGFLWSFIEFDGKEGEGRNRLMLQVTSPEGCSGLVPGCTLDRPAGWVAPYGLR